MNSSKRIIVAGAGFAGLAAAYELIGQGYSVTVLEARQRVGGRVWSEKLSNGAIVELGGEWVGSNDHTVLAMAKRVNQPLVPLGVDFRIRGVVNGTAVPPTDQRKAHRIAFESLLGMDEGTVARSTVGEFLNSLSLNKAQASLLRARLQGSYGADLYEIALRMLGEYSLGESGTYYRFAGGNQLLAKAMADQLPDVRLGHAVTAVSHGQDAVSIAAVTADGAYRLEADAVILALPPKPMIELEFEPALPPAQAEAFASVAMGVAGKLAIGTQDAPSLRAIQDVTAPYWCWTGNGQGSGPRSAVTAFCGSKQAQKILATDSRDASIWLNRLQSANPDLAFVGDPIMVDWSLDEWVRGCYSAFDNEATDRIPLLSLPAGRILFAGEHTAVESGTMEGALASGLNAARQVGEVL